MHVLCAILSGPGYVDTRTNELLGRCELKLAANPSQAKLVNDARLSGPS